MGLQHVSVARLRSEVGLKHHPALKRARPALCLALLCLPALYCTHSSDTAEYNNGLRGTHPLFSAQVRVQDTVGSNRGA